MASVYEEIGGAAAVEAAVDSFNARVLADPALARYFKDLDLDRVKAHQRAFLTAAVGDPEWQAGGMDAAHGALPISGDEFDKFVGHVTATLSECGVAPTTVGAITATLEPLRARVVTGEGPDPVTIRPGTVTSLPIGQTEPAASKQRVS